MKMGRDWLQFGNKETNWTHYCARLTTQMKVRKKSMQVNEGVSEREEPRGEILLYLVIRVVFRVVVVVVKVLKILIIVRGVVRQYLLVFPLLVRVTGTAAVLP